MTPTPDVSSPPPAPKPPLSDLLPGILSGCDGVFLPYLAAHTSTPMPCLQKFGLSTCILRPVPSCAGWDYIITNSDASLYLTPSLTWVPTLTRLTKAETLSLLTSPDLPPLQSWPYPSPFVDIAPTPLSPPPGAGTHSSADVTISGAHATPTLPPTTPPFTRTPYRHGFEDAQDRGWNASMTVTNHPDQLDEYQRGYNDGTKSLAAAQQPLSDDKLNTIRHLLPNQGEGDPTMEDLIALGQRLMKECGSVLRDRNQAYSFGEDIFGNLRIVENLPPPPKLLTEHGIIIRTFDKLARLWSLSSGASEIDEKFEDTVRDALGYLTWLALARRQRSKP